MTTTQLQTCYIAAASLAAEELSLPLTFFDIIWLPFHPIRRLVFYEIRSCSKEYFLDNLVLKLKDSLSVTLKHYFPLAGNLAYPLDTENNLPFIRCGPGDSVPLTIAESNAEFDNLVGNHARDADQFYDLIPQLPPISEESGYQLLQVFAVQITLFPGRGICVGLANHHVVGDASSVIGFIQTWAEISKHGGDGELLKSLPVFDRSLVKIPPGVNSFYWNQMRKQYSLKPSSFPLPTNRVRATFVFNQTEIKKLKDLLGARRPGLVHISSFVVTAAYMWTCLLKAVASSEDEEVDDGIEEAFMFAVDARARMDPPVPGNFFGNCLAYGIGKVGRGEVMGEEGFIVAGEAIAMEIQNRVNDIKKLMANMENWLSDITAAMKKWVLSVSGSARVDVYNADFGWGKMRKLEMLSIDEDKYSVSLCKSSDPAGGLEYGLSLPKVVMEGFAIAFADGMKSLAC